ncbi:MAG: methyltransferase [Gammaproteobacteria bacterium]|nr:methyltransferase [Gammaproteobacteria bacterium]
MGDLWQSATRQVAVGDVRISIVAAGDCPGRVLDRYIEPLVRAAGLPRGRFIDVCGWDGALGAALLANSSGEGGVCNSHLIGSAMSARVNLNGTECEVRSAYGIEAAQIGRFDTALVRAPYWLGNRAVRALIAAAWRSLREGGAAYLAGERGRGFDTFAGMLSDVFGKSEPVAIAGRVRVARAQRVEGYPARRPTFTGDFEESVVAIGGSDVLVARHPAVYADGTVDDATRMLIDCLPKTSGRQLDLGCGSGLVAAAMARKSPESQITAVDSNLVAVDVCARTIDLNGLDNVEVRASYFGEDLATGSFDVIACYPPFHVGPNVSHDAAKRLIREAARLLKPMGNFLAVQSSAQSHEDLLNACFGRICLSAQSRSYRVYRCSNPLAG